MKEGDVVIAPMPQSDGQLKRRPVIILRKMRPYDDLLVCGISTQMHQQVVDFDEIISQPDDDFISSGLNAQSLVRLGFLFVLPSRRIQGIVGEVSSERHQRLLEKLCKYLLGQNSI